MKKILFLILFALFSKVYADVLSFDDMHKAGFQPSVPLIYVFNQQGLVIQAGGGSGTNPYALLESISHRPEKIPHLSASPEPELKKNLTSLLPDKKWQVSDTGLVVIFALESSTPNCVTCEQLDGYIEKIKKQGKPELVVLRVKR